MENITIEAFGSITKLEKLSSIKHNIISNSFVLESQEPFPGYYEKSMPRSLTPKSIFLVLKNGYDLEQVTRVSQIVREKMEKNCLPAFAEIHMTNSTYHAVRIIGLDCYYMIPDIQEAFAEEGIYFRKSKDIEKQMMIRIFKTFRVKEIKEGCYMDMDDKQMGYVELPSVPSWEKFEVLTRDVKNNLDNSNFDAALAMMYRHKGIIDLVRVYDSKIDTGRLDMIQKTYAAACLKESKETTA